MQGFRTYVHRMCTKCAKMCTFCLFWGRLGLPRDSPCASLWRLGRLLWNPLGSPGELGMTSDHYITIMSPCATVMLDYVTICTTMLPHAAGEGGRGVRGRGVAAAVGGPPPNFGGWRGWGAWCSQHADHLPVTKPCKLRCCCLSGLA